MNETFKDNHKLIDMDNEEPMPTRSRLRKGPAPEANPNNGRGYRKNGSQATKPPPIT